jgi:hypothetical protein
VRKAIKDNKLIVIMRSEKQWNEAVAELETYTNKIILKNKRNPTVSSGNMTEKEFNTIIAVLKNAEKTEAVKEITRARG